MNTAPPSPGGSASVQRDAVELETSSSPSKQAKVETPDQVMSARDRREDEELELSFQENEIEILEGYDNDIDDEGYDRESGTCGNSDFDKLIFEFTPHEPNLTEQELKVLDDIADRVEIQRLCDMGVLLPASEASESSVVRKNLSTRFVRTWREKMIDNKLAGFIVAGSWHVSMLGCVKRTDLFSPASNALGGRLLQTLCLRMRHAGNISSSVDIGEAFLSVPQKEYTVVSLTILAMCCLASGQVHSYGMRQSQIFCVKRQTWFSAQRRLICFEVWILLATL